MRAPASHDLYPLTFDQIRVDRPTDRVSVTVHKPFGSDKGDDVEYSMTDIEAFLSDLMKGNPRNIELLLNTRFVYQSREWARLCELAPLLLTRRAVAQFAGFVHDRVRKARTALTDDSNRVAASKYLYHAYHKLFGLEAAVRGTLPPVQLSGPLREFVLNIRTKPHEVRARPVTVRGVVVTRPVTVRGVVVTTEWGGYIGPVVNAI